MLRKTILWTLAILVTYGSAKYQRATGPTHPIDDQRIFAEQTISYSLTRTHGGEGNQPIVVKFSGSSIDGKLHYRRYKAPEAFTVLPMTPAGDSLTGYLPHQPPAGKLEYYVELIHNDKSLIIPGDQTVVTRFKGAVPKTVLAPHIILMFAVMLLATRTGLEALFKDGRLKKLTLITTMILAVGGMIMGPVVQKYAFGAFWTGVPFGWDLTDNKTLIAFIGWLIALWRTRVSTNSRWWVLAAAIILMGIFMIPHSMMGSELDYASGEVKTG